MLLQKIGKRNTLTKSVARKYKQIGSQYNALYN